jgi:hypothetical protein
MFKPDARDKFKRLGARTEALAPVYRLRDMDAARGWQVRRKSKGLDDILVVCLVLEPIIKIGDGRES